LHPNYIKNENKEDFVIDYSDWIFITAHERERERERERFLLWK
jgi:hypothetical protein